MERFFRNDNMLTIAGYSQYEQWDSFMSHKTVNVRIG